MDADRFDSLIRVLRTAPSRRGLVRSLLGAGFAGSLWASAVEPAAAKKCPPCRKKKKGKCRGKKPNGAPCGGACLGCQNGTCVATTGASCGDGECLDNGSCVFLCDPEIQDCQADCWCRTQSGSPDSYCTVEAIPNCAALASCIPTQGCPRGGLCTACGGSDRCVPLCEA